VIATARQFDNGELAEAQLAEVRSIHATRTTLSETYLNRALGFAGLVDDFTKGRAAGMDQAMLVFIQAESKHLRKRYQAQTSVCTQKFVQTTALMRRWLNGELNEEEKPGGEQAHDKRQITNGKTNARNREKRVIAGRLQDGERRARDLFDVVERGHLVDKKIDTQACCMGGIMDGIQFTRYYAHKYPQLLLLSIS
jgi:hypothetical protein